jgi:RNA polymerase sigma-70 factor, ECF subfamily
MADLRVFDENAILRQSASLRRMVRALVRDDAAADDVVQETWLTAMRSPEPGFGPAAWLRGIARNVVRTVRRGDARRARRELESYVPATDPGADDHAARIERLRELLDVVSGLREPSSASSMA